MTRLTASRLQGIEISLIRRINALAQPGSINLGIGEPNIEPDDSLKAMAEEATRGQWSYSPNAGFLSLRERIAASNEGSIDPEREVCVTAGTEEALYAIMQAFVDRGEEVLVPDPGFVAYSTLARLAGGIPVAYPLTSDGWKIDFDALERLMTERTRMVVINSPSNPTGAVIDQDDLERIVSIADERELLLVSDEVYREIHYGEAPRSVIGMSRRAIAVQGLSKSHSMTGLRIGWALASPELTAPIVTMHQYIATCASVVSQRMAELILTRRAWNEAWLARMRAAFRRQRDTAVEATRQSLYQPFDPPAGAFYLFVPVPSCATVLLATELATTGGVVVIPGVAFGSSGEGFLRISFAASESEIREGIARIGKYLDSAGRG